MSPAPGVDESEVFSRSGHLASKRLHHGGLELRWRGARVFAKHVDEHIRAEVRDGPRGGRDG
eukprot:430840-Lingulodinium_polyedra.AAC.1